MTTVLVVDDSATDRRLAAGLLKKNEEVEVTFAADGCEALAQIEQHPPDIVVTDLQMPNMNGLELVQAIRKQFPQLPVVLMTGKGSEEIAVQALENGAASYVTKKRLARDLPETVSRVLATVSEHRHRRQLKSRMTTGEFEFTLENDPQLLSTAVQFVCHLLREFEVCHDSDYSRIGTALDEALHNAFYHGNLEIRSELKLEDGDQFYELAKSRCQETPYRDRQIYLRTAFSADHVLFVIRDEGCGFNPTLLPDPTDPANLGRPFGRGILLMRTFMDALEFNATGNEVTLMKQRVRPAGTNGQ
ncbi:response regulator [Symmachiella dynata]|uniref:Chemotaxis protein CheY n=1 Tax=Symmachiella dynata TaxID=2527995 RepID=A0A517ZK08_9PLAN|nr:response regulator [Symmachiella dynata]QDT47295.1 Chemotaxis protein CheY [Symmachiella dynata]QDU42798.1 Chemotaxis protein CheY [Symmachiella dynata]